MSKKKAEEAKVDAGTFREEITTYKTKNVISIDTYVLMQATLFGATSPSYKHLDVNQAKTLADIILSMNGYEVEGKNV